MQTTKKNIFEALTAMGHFKRVSPHYPNDFSLLPAATVSESKRPLMAADDEYYLWDKETPYGFMF